MKRLCFSLVVLCCSALLTAGVWAEEGHFKITDINGRETAHVVGEGLVLDIEGYAKLIFMTNTASEAYRDPDGLGIEVEDSYWVCVPFSLIQAGEKVEQNESEFVVRLFPGSPVESIRGKLAPRRDQFREHNPAARIKGKFQVAGMTGDFSLPLEELSSISWIGEPPAKQAEAALEGRPATLFLANGKKLEVADLHRYRNRYITSQYINVSSYYQTTREENIVLATGESELKIPFDKISEIAFLDKGVSVKLVDGTDLQFDRISSKYGDATDGFAARSRLGSIYVRADKVRKIEFGSKTAARAGTGR